MVCVRSAWIDSSTPGGKLARKAGSCSRIWSTVSMTLASACLRMNTSTARLPLYQPARRAFSWPLITVATEDSGIGTPSRVAMMALRKSSTVASWSSASMTQVCASSLKEPLARLTVSALIAVRTVAIDRPICASCAGFAWMRIAGFAAPEICTSATPSTCDRLGFNWLSANS